MGNSVTHFSGWFVHKTTPGSIVRASSGSLFPSLSMCGTELLVERGFNKCLIYFLPVNLTAEKHIHYNLNENRKSGHIDHYLISNKRVNFLSYSTP